MTATDTEAVADSAEAREPRDGGQNVLEDPRPVWRRIDRADAARTLFTGLCAAVAAFAPAWADRWPSWGWRSAAGRSPPRRGRICATGR